MATSRATPIAIPVWRIMLIAPEPVANDEGGSDDVLTPIKVGSANQQRAGRHRETDLQSRPAPDHLIPQHHRQQKRAKGRRKRSDSQRGSRKRTDAEQVRIDKRVGRPKTVRNEPPEENDRRGAGSNDARRMPTPVVYLDDRENQGRHTGGHHYRCSKMRM